MGESWGFWDYGIVSIFLHAVRASVTGRGQIVIQGSFWAIHAGESDRASSTFGLPFDYQSHFGEAESLLITVAP